MARRGLLSLIVDERRGQRDAETVGEPLDTVALAQLANDGMRAYLLTAEQLDRWLVGGGLARRGDDGRLRLTREAWSLAGRAFG